MSKKSETYGALAALLAALLLFLILFFCTIIVRQDADPEGVEVNFGDVLEASGLYEPAPAEVLEMPSPAEATPPAPTAQNVEQPLQTQDLEESLAVKEAKKAEQKRKAEQRAAEQKRLEQERLERERLAEEKRQAEEKARQAAAISNRAIGAFGGAGSGTSASEGTASSGTGNEGNPLGTESKNKGVGGGSGGSASFSLGNRKINGTIPRPSDNTQVSGKIVVEITVDASGNVIAATIGQGTTIAEASARKAALDAAKRAKFTKGERTEIGIITYHFKLE